MIFDPDLDGPCSLSVCGILVEDGRMTWELGTVYCDYMVKVDEITYTERDHNFDEDYECVVDPASRTAWTRSADDALGRPKLRRSPRPHPRMPFTLEDLAEILEHHAQWSLC